MKRLHLQCGVFLPLPEVISEQQLTFIGKFVTIQFDIMNSDTFITDINFEILRLLLFWDDQNDL